MSDEQHLDRESTIEQLQKLGMSADDIRRSEALAALSLSEEEMDELASDLAETLKSAIEDALDADAYNQELAAEEADSANILAVRAQAEQFSFRP